MENISLQQHFNQIDKEIISRIIVSSDNDLLSNTLKDGLYHDFEIAKIPGIPDKGERLVPKIIYRTIGLDIEIDGQFGQKIECAIFEISILGDINTTFFKDWFFKKFKYLEKRADYNLNINSNKLTFEEITQDKTTDEIENRITQKINNVKKNLDELNSDIVLFNIELRQFIENSIETEKNKRAAKKDKQDKFTLFG